MIEITVSGTIDAAVEEVYKLLKDYKAYGDWWSIPTELVEGKENYFQFTPLPFIKVGLELDFKINNKCIQFKYVKGPFRGTGKWEIFDKKNNKTQVDYTIRLKPLNIFIRLATQTLVFKRKHIRDIEYLINEIEKKTISKT